MRLPVNSFLRKRYLAFKQDSRNLKHKTKKGVVSLIRNQVVTLARNTLVTLNRNQVVSLRGISNEHQVSYLMVRLNNLPKSTQHIFNFAKGRQYYLEVIEDGQISKERLKFLYKLIFGKIDDMEQLSKIVSFCTYLANEKSMFVREDFQYIDSSTTFLIKDSLQSFFKEE